MVDIQLLVDELRKHGHNVEHWRPLPGNAGEYEVEINGEQLTLDEARALLGMDEGI